jgi:aldehyde dehydrogenase (NAD+)
MTTTSAAPQVPIAEPIESVATRLRATFASGRTRPIAWRKAQLSGLERMLAEREGDFVAALSVDLGRRAVDSWLADVAPVTAESAYARKHLTRWNRRKRVSVPLAAMPGRAWYEYEPLGVVLIIGPWNYPVQLTLAPLVGALSAGNCAILKPSEHTPTVSALLAELLPQYLDPDAVAVVEGEAAATQELIDQALDHVFFTGGPEIGKAVMGAAAKHLTPVTLELGGKSPVIINDDAVIRVAARRIAFSKLINSGQTCVAPDYLLVHRSIRDEFLTELDQAIDELSKGSDPMLPIVSSRQTARIAGLLDGAGGNVVRQGAFDVERHTAEITIVVDPDPKSNLMSQEIFGPVLPVITVDSLDEAIAKVNEGPKPLAVYLFSGSRKAERRVLDEISNGGTVINHLMFQVLVTPLPFGGVGNSGMGTYHGRWGFETFSHRKSVVRKPARPDPSFVYPPYTPFKEKLMRRVF